MTPLPAPARSPVATFFVDWTGPEGRLRRYFVERERAERFAQEKGSRVEMVQ